MSEYAGKVSVSTLFGGILTYIIDFSTPGFVLKHLIKMDTGINIKEQQLVFNKDLTIWRNKTL